MEKGKKMETQNPQDAFLSAIALVGASHSTFGGERSARFGDRALRQFGTGFVEEMHSTLN